MEQKKSLLLLLNEIGSTSVTILLIAGVLFGIAFTYSHFWAIRKFVLKSTHFRGVIFILTFIRLFVFALALILASFPNHGGVRMMLFFVGFMVGRIGLMHVAKKEIAKQ